MNIVLMIRSLGHGGSERQLTNLAIGLHRRGHDVVVVQLLDGDQFATELERAGVPVWTVGVRGRWDLPRLGARLHAIRRLRADVVHGFHAESNLLAMATALGSAPRVVCGIRHPPEDDEPADLPARAFQHLHDRLLNRAALVIANSRIARSQLLARGLSPERVIAIDNGVDTERFSPDAAARRALRAEWGIGENEVLIGSVARLDPIKDYPTFLRAASIAQDDASVRFVCVGDGPAAYRSKLERLAAASGLGARIRWLGARYDMPRVYNALDVCTVPSRREALSNAACEAIACGVPCVVSAVGDNSRLARAAVVVPPQNAVALVEGWRRARAMTGADRAAARSWIGEAFSPERQLDETERALADLLSAPPDSRSAAGAAR